MTLATRIIPTLLCRGRQLIKGKRFDSWRSCGLAAQAVRIHQARGVDELVLLDIGATPENRGPDLHLVEELAQVCFMPLAVGGGVRSLEDVQKLLASGADKVVIGTALFEDPYLATKIADRIGRQVLVAAVDVKDGVVWTHCGRVAHKSHPAAYCEVLQIMGVGEILLTSIDREGMMEGYDEALIAQVADRVDLPVIAHGGAGSYEHLALGLTAGASAVAAGSLFQWTDATPQGAAQYLDKHGFTVRLQEPAA